MQSALYGLVLSLLICVAAVAVFTTHVLLLLPVLLSILGMCAGDEVSKGLWQVTTGQAWACGWWNSGPGSWEWDQGGVFWTSEPLATQS